MKTVSPRLNEAFWHPVWSMRTMRFYLHYAAGAEGC